MSETEVKVPNIGDFKDVEIIEVLVSEGQILKKNDPLITIESDKSSVEIPSNFEGKIKSLRTKVGDKVSEGDLILVLDNKSQLNEIAEEKQEIEKEFKKIKNVSYENSIKKSLQGSDLVIIHTEWNDFKSINFKNLIKGKKFIIYDMRNLYSASKIKAQGLRYYSVGQ